MSSNAIEFSLGQDIVEARVTLSVSRLNDILHLIIDRSNHHGVDISQLQSELAEMKERCAKLEKSMDDLKPDGEKQQRLESTMESLANQLERIRRDYDHRIDSAAKQNKIRHEQFDLSIQSLQDELLKQTAWLRDATTKQAQLGAECKDRLDALVIPDISHLESLTDKLATWKSEANDRLRHCLRFVNLWSPNPDELVRICGRAVGWNDNANENSDRFLSPTRRGSNKVRGKGGNTPDDQPTAGTTDSSYGTTTPVKDGTPPKTPDEPLMTDNEREAKEMEKVRYAHSLPPMEHLIRMIKEAESRQITALDYKSQQLNQKIAEKISKHEIAELANSMKEQQQELKQSMEFLDRRLKENDDLTVRMSLVEEKVKYLHYHKAESTSLDFKADNSVVQDLKGEMMEVRDDIADIFSKLMQQAAGAGGLAGLPRGGSFGSISGPAGRRMSALPGAQTSPTAGGGENPNGSMNAGNETLSRGLSKRLTEMAELLTSLEKRKADREDIARLHEYIEFTEKKDRHGAGGGGSQGSLVQSPKTRHLVQSAAAGAPVPDGMPSKVSSTLAVRPPQSPRTPGDAAGGLTLSEHALAEAAGNAGQGQTPLSSSHPHSATAGGRPHSGPYHMSTKRIGSAQTRSLQNLDGGNTGSLLVEEGIMQGVAFTGTVDLGVHPTTTVRQFLGRSVVGVRDSSGASVPASIGTAHHHELYKLAPQSTSPVS
jgi:hypothetical protein